MLESRVPCRTGSSLCFHVIFDIINQDQIKPQDGMCRMLLRCPPPRPPHGTVSWYKKESIILTRSVKNGKNAL